MTMTLLTIFLGCSFLFRRSLTVLDGDDLGNLFLGVLSFLPLILAVLDDNDLEDFLF